MKKILLMFPLFLFLGISKLIAQTSLELGMDGFNIDINLPSFLNASENIERIYVAEITDKNPVPEIAQQFGSKITFGETYFNVFFGTVNAILTYKNDECVVFVYTSSPFKGSNNYGQIVQDSAKLFTFKNIPFARIKHDFKYGLPNNYPSELEADELYSMLTHHSYDRAKKMFNANVLVSYPLNFRGNIYKNKYTRGRAVVAGKDYRVFYLYFIMTDKSVLEFEKYLNDFERVFYFRD